MLYGDVGRTLNNEWSDRDLQVFDLKAAVAPSSACVIEAGRAGSRPITLAVPGPIRAHCRYNLADFFTKPMKSAAQFHALRKIIMNES